MNDGQVEYLLIGAYAVGYHGYPRATTDIDVWIARTSTNAARMAEALYRFGFSRDAISADDLIKEHKIFRFGVPPLRIEVHTSISGVEFTECFARKVDGVVDGVPTPLINLDDLKANKRASGRHKDLADLDNLPT